MFMFMLQSIYFYSASFCLSSNQFVFCSLLSCKLWWIFRLRLTSSPLVRASICLSACLPLSLPSYLFRSLAPFFSPEYSRYSANANEQLGLKLLPAKLYRSISAILHLIEVVFDGVSANMSGFLRDRLAISVCASPSLSPALTVACYCCSILPKAYEGCWRKALVLAAVVAVWSQKPIKFCGNCESPGQLLGCELYLLAWQRMGSAGRGCVVAGLLLAGIRWV